MVLKEREREGVLEGHLIKRIKEGQNTHATFFLILFHTQIHSHNFLSPFSLSLSLSLILCLVFSFSVYLWFFVSLVLFNPPSLSLCEFLCVCVCLSLTLSLSVCFCMSLFLSVCVSLFLSLCVCVYVSLPPCVSKCVCSLSLSLLPPLSPSSHFCQLQYLTHLLSFFPFLISFLYPFSSQETATYNYRKE